MGYAKILALDLGKFKSVGCAMDVASKGHAFATLETNREALKAWVVAQAGGAAAADASPSALVVFEACDAAGWVHDLLAPLAGVAVTVVNCNDERWRWRRVKRKTDRDDALKLARLALLDELPSVHVPAPDAAAAAVDAAPTQRRRAADAVPQRDPLDLQPAGPRPGARQ